MRSNSHPFCHQPADAAARHQNARFLPLVADGADTVSCHAALHRSLTKALHPALN
jgi:hypothetical protein